MANTGYKQAGVAYKVDATTGEPLDIDGNRISKSGKKQAIVLLQGRINPDPNKYEVQGYFTKGELIGGEPSKIWDPAECPIGVIFVTPARVVAAPASAPFEITLFSSGDWSLSASNPLASFSQTAGSEGFNYITVSPNVNEGQHDYIFTNTGTGTVAIFRLILTNDSDLWILANGTWNNLGFWINSATWNY